MHRKVHSHSRHGVSDSVHSSTPLLDPESRHAPIGNQVLYRFLFLFLRPNLPSWCLIIWFLLFACLFSCLLAFTTRSGPVIYWNSRACRLQAHRIALHPERSPPCVLPGGIRTHYLVPSVVWPLNTNIARVFFVNSPPNGISYVPPSPFPRPLFPLQISHLIQIYSISSFSCILSLRFQIGIMPFLPFSSHTLTRFSNRSTPPTQDFPTTSI